MGSSSAAFTLDIYAGLFADDLDEVADRLDAAARTALGDGQRTGAAPAEGDPGSEDGE